MSLIHAYQNRGKTWEFQINGSDGSAVTPGDSDKVRIIIGREGQLGVDLSNAELVVTSESSTDAGSSITTGSTNTLRLDATDLASIEPGIYTLFVDYYDSSDGDEWKNVDRQVFSLEST